jgi:hypothetical protein
MDDNILRDILYVVCRFLLSSAIAGAWIDIAIFQSGRSGAQLSASPVADIDQDEGRRSAGAVEYPWEGEPCLDACDPTSDSLATLSYEVQHMTLKTGRFPDVSD